MNRLISFRQPTIRVAMVCCVSAFTLDTAPGATIAPNPVGDAFVTSAHPDSNYGGAGAVVVSAGGLPKGEFQSLLSFNVSSARTGFDSIYGAGRWAIESVSLQLTAASPNNPLFNSSAAGQFSVGWMQYDDWLEGTGTPSAPAAAGITFNTLAPMLSASDESLGTFSFSGGTSGATVYTLGLASGFMSDLLGSGLVSLRLAPADSTVSGVFNSRSFGTVANRPVLAITAVPEPVTALLLVLGLSIAFRRWPGER